MTNPFHIPSDPQPLPQSDNAEVHIGGGNTRVSVGGGVEVRSSDLGNGAKGLMATAQRANSRVPASPSTLTPNDTIEIGGQRMSLKIAESMGYLQRNANTGLYEEATNAASPDIQQLQQQADDAKAQHDDWDNPKPEPFHAEGEKFVSMIPQAVQSVAINDIAETGQITEDSVKRMAADLGVEPAQAQHFIGGAVELYARQANAVLSGYGIEDGAAFAQWAMKARASDWREAIQRHQIERTTVAYHDLAKGYLEHLHRTDPDLILHSDFGPGVTTRKAGREVILKIPGIGEMPFRAAIKAGFIGRGRR